MTPEQRAELTEALAAIGGSADEDWAVYAERLGPLVDRFTADALRAAYWGAAAIPDAEAVRDVLRARADALDPS